MGNWSVLRFALAITHVGWAVSLLLEGSRYAGRLAEPQLFAALHVLTALLLVGRRASYAGGLLSGGILTYYTLYVKPLEPIAEPQSVGLIFLSLSLVLRKGDTETPESLGRALLRLSLAYPFVEWGLDAFRNPGHFISYMGSNPITALLIPKPLLPMAALILGSIELSLSSLLLLGMAVKQAALATLLVLLVFMVVAGYPLALPQNIALASAAYILARHGAGRIALEEVIQLMRRNLRSV